MQIIHENEYEETMKNIVTPYLLSHRRELYVPGADYPFRNESKRITGKIHMLQYLSDIDMPKGDRKSTRLNSSHNRESRMPSSA